MISSYYSQSVKVNRHRLNLQYQGGSSYTVLCYVPEDKAGNVCRSPVARLEQEISELFAVFLELGRSTSHSNRTSVVIEAAISACKMSPTSAYIQHKSSVLFHYYHYYLVTTNYYALLRGDELDTNSCC